ncbi:MAG: tetratricopeptide repeat protein [Lentisphaeria bacterium]|nr:tetratricopeptide repeat protein [Lentisphaeria bacterium]
MGTSAAAAAGALDDRIQAFDQARTQTEGAVARILEAGLAEQRAAEAYAAVSTWLRENPTSSQQVLFQAGQVARFAGEYSEAFSFYRKLLKNKSIDGELAAEAVPITYRMLANDMRDETAAYLFMREDGDRLRQYGQAKQFDHWFLRRARQRGDLAAMADRLAAVHSDTADVSNYDEYMKGLFRELESFEKRDERTVEALNRLANVSRDPEFKLRWDWIKTVTDYNAEAQKVDIKREKPSEELLVDPLKAARALIAADPVGGAAFVVKGWAQWNQSDTPTFFRYVHAHRNLKSTVFIDALKRLSPEQAKRMLTTGAHGPRGRWVSVAGFISPEQAKLIIPRLPAIFNAIDAPDVDIWHKDLTVEEAKVLAPRLVRNPHPHAALIRAFAAVGEKKIDPMIVVMAKSESWRFAGDNKTSAARRMVDMAWNSGIDRSGGDHGKTVTRYEREFNTRAEQLKKQVGETADSKNRMAAFNKLHGELLGNPATPGLLGLWDECLTQASNPDKQHMLQKLVADFISAPPASKDTHKYLLGQALAKVTFGNPYSRLSFGPAFAGGWDRWGYNNVRKACPDLAADLGQQLRRQMAAGNLSEPVFGMWLSCVEPKSAEAKTFFQELIKSPAYDTVNPAYHRMAADNVLFGSAAITKRAPYHPRVVSRELLALPEDATPQQVAAAFKAVMTRLARTREPVAVLGLRPVAGLPDLTGETRQLALSLFNGQSPLGDYPERQGYEQLAARLIDTFRQSEDWGGIIPYAASLWRSASSPDDNRSDHGNHHVEAALIAYSEAALETAHLSTALALAKNGLHRGLPAGDRKARLNAVAGKAGLAIGMFEIPVDETHPTYPLYQSNSDYVQGNLDAAWELYEANADKLLKPSDSGDQQAPLLRKLPTEYAFWLLRRDIEAGKLDRAEALAKELMIWSRQAEGTFSREQEGELKLAFAELAFRKGALDSARALYRLVADAREFQGSPMYLDAALGSVTIDRINRNFGAAMTELDKLMSLKDPESRKRVHFARAEVLMDQENYKEAAEAIQSVLRHDPNHADALLLQSKIQYEMRKLVEASQVMLGISRENTIIVPGETIKIDLHDPTLHISGLGADIEIEIWAESGDKERVMLHQLGDDKERFRAEVPTLLGPPAPNDKKLQILGEDEIRFGYSKRFRDKMDDLPPDPDMVIGVASDAYMALSAGAFPPREGERKLDIEELGLSTAQQRLGTRAVRPGNPIYLRVVDADQSKTARPDTLSVTLKTTSGDEIRRLRLTETGPYTGEFEAVIPTTGAQAMAFASESAPGRDPNMAISAKDYPGWLGQVGDKTAMRTFGVDLNDNVALDKMTFSWGEASQGLTHFVLQTSMNGKDWITRARYPEDAAPWDGRPQVTSFPTYGRNHIPISTPKGRELPTDWIEKMDLTSARPDINYIAQYVPDLAKTQPQLADGGHPGYSVLVRYRALFYQPEAAIRTFRLTGYPLQSKQNGKDVEQPTFFLIDGQPAAEDADDPMLIERELKPGLHEIQIWRHESRGELEKRRPVILCDVPGKQDLEPCSVGLFNPANFPEGVRARIARPAKIITVTEGEEGLKVAFGDNTQARLARLAIFGFNGVAPTIKKMTLSDRDGHQLLPVTQDFLALRQNEQLEVLPGDRITAFYEDPVPATPKRDKHSRSLTVAFNTATITASFLNYITTKEGRVLQLEQIRRFDFDAAIGIFIDDADMDSSPERDIIEFTVTTSEGKKVTQKAVETEAHSGRFEGRIFPVAGTPKRDSEIQLPEGGTITAAYRDMENLDPGIPADRSVTIEHAKYTTPKLAAYSVRTRILPRPEIPKQDLEAKADKNRRRVTGPEAFFQRGELEYIYSDEATPPASQLKGVVGATLHLDVIASHLALAASSEITAYVQTEAGRQMPRDKEQSASGQPFDISVPGTLKLTGTLHGHRASAPKGYAIAVSPKPPVNTPPLEEGRFAFSIPLALGNKPARSYATKDADLLPSSAKPEALAVRAGDVVHVGYAYKDKNGDPQWKTTSFTIGGHAFLEVMDKGYNQLLDQAFVGEKVYVRVLGYGLDQSPERDTTHVTLSAASGAKTVYNLRETEPHSGVFKGVFTINYADDVLPEELPPVELNGFPVRYGDDVVINYPAADESPAQSWTVRVNKGADGLVEPFSKRYTGDAMAIKTSFTLAECFFELAKKHSKLDQESLSRREIEHARKLLAEAMASHRDDDMHAHAEYLLGNLAQEFADLAKNDESKLPMYQDALKRFSKIPTDYPDSPFAPKAQFKIGLIYEKMGEADNSVEEYVKLAYKYPNHELIPTIMLRLGTYFQKKGLAYKKQADPLREKDDIESKADVLRLDDLSYPEFISAAIIYAKLPERFPDNPLAGLAALAASQNYMRAHQYQKAIEGFEKTYENEAYDGRDIRAQAMYWSGLSSERWAAALSEDDWKGRGKGINDAYKIYRRVTFDFPDSKWAKFARGRLTDPVFGKIIETEALMRERMLESLEYEKKKRNR